MSAAEIAAADLEADLATESVLIEELDALGTPSAQSLITDERTFARSRPCPAGGLIEVEGTISRTYEPLSRVMEAHSSGQRRRIGCTFGMGPLSVSIDGESKWEWFRRRVNGLPDGPQTSHYAGRFTAVRSDGRERSCEFDYTIVRDPSSRTRTIDGTVCGSLIHRRVDWDGQR